MGDEKEKGFRVIDKRRIGREDAPEEKSDVPPVGSRAAEGAKQAKDASQEPKKSEGPAEKTGGSGDYARETPPRYHEPDFTDIVKSFFMQALASLGMLEGEGMTPGEPNLEIARQYIDLLGVLERKTRGNLSEEEDSLIKEYLSQLRMVYVKVAQGVSNNP
ncbi:MAG: DUF1844 domain-containing protein [Deltaproteobacteria bacterium]|nr:DUF1844 domain-containing protein [Deltaproteobacteria bacterium]NIS77470.1 DUF1844 domain-containing protein [Deltaproteobacteria bacterium]